MRVFRKRLTRSVYADTVRIKGLGYKAAAAFLLLCLLLPIFFMPQKAAVWAASLEAPAVKAEVITETIMVRDIAYYDVWKHIDGTWQFGKMPGADVSAAFTISIGGRLPQDAIVINVIGSYDNGYAGAYSAASVPNAFVNIKSYTNSTLTYAVSTKLTGSPEDIRRDTQSEFTEGYRYYIPAIFEITYKTEYTASPVPDIETNDSSNLPVQDESISGEAVLILPKTSYEGHSVTADDRSVFTVDNKTYGAARMYSEGLAANRFTVSGAGGSARKDGETSARVTFIQSGSASVLLTVTTKNQLRLTDRKEIEVLQTPKINSELGGTQKQNRRQVITADIAVNPAYPLKELWIEIEKRDGSERVHLNFDVNGGKNERDNSAMIKTRTIRDTGSNQLFTRVELEFLTKNNQRQEMTYRVHAKDQRGYSSTDEQHFTVADDTPPAVKIAAEPEQIRSEKSNYAQVTAEDATVYDGDTAERTWYVKEEGETIWRQAGEPLETDKTERGDAGSIAPAGTLSDASFGTWKSIVYQKKGVGKLKLRLDVKELWTEETLTEYVDEKDRLSGSAEISVDVINIAPVVSLTSARMKEANLLMLAADDKSMKQLAQRTSALRKSLLESGISAEIELMRVKNADELNQGEKADSIFTLSRPYGYIGTETFLEKNWYLAGKEILYTVDGTWAKNTGITNAHYYKASAPYTISAYSLSGLSDASLQAESSGPGMESGTKSGEEALWTVTVSKEQLGRDDIREIVGMASDDRGKYLFFRTMDRTLVYDGMTGAYIMTVPLAFGDDNYVYDSRIYTIRKDGIYAADMKNGSVKRLYAETLCMKSSYCDSAGSSFRISGEVHFLTGKGGTLMRGIFYPRTEEFRFIEIQPSKAEYRSTYTVIGFGADGCVAVGQDEKNIVYVFDRSGDELGCFSGWQTDSGHDVLPVYKSDGTFDYLVSMYNTDYRTGTQKNGYKMNYGIYMTLHEVRSMRGDAESENAGAAPPISYNYLKKTSDSAPSGSGTDAARAMYAVQIGNEVIVNSGGWATSISDGSPLSSYYNILFSQIVFDTEKRTAQRYINVVPEHEMLHIGGIVCEYGKRTADYIISAYSQDSAAYPYGEGSNRQALRVARLPKTEDEEAAFHVDQWAPVKTEAGFDFAMVAFCGEMAEGLAKSGDFSDYRREAESLAAAEKDEQQESYFIPLGLLSEQGYSRLKSSLIRSENEAAVVNAEDVEVLCTLIGSSGSSGRYLKIKTDEPERVTEIYKTYTLLPNKEYYCEFDYRGNQDNPLSVEIKTEKALPSQVLQEISESTDFTGKKFVAVQLEEECFQEADSINPYFSGIEEKRFHDEKYYGAEMLFGKDSGINKTRFDSSSISFEIEAGRTAVLQFDYTMEGCDGGADEVYIDINGERWYRNVNLLPNSGTYTHPHFLPEGVNTLSFAARFYGTRPDNTWIAIDNLKVIYLEENEGEAENDAAALSALKDKTERQLSSENFYPSGFREVRSTLKTPEKIVSYAGQRALYIKQSALSSVQEFIVNTKGEYQNDLSITIPEGKKAVHTALTLRSSPADRYAVRWNFDGKAFQANYSTAANYYAVQVPKVFRVNTMKPEGTIEVSPGHLYKRGAGYGEIEMIMTNNIYAPVSAGKYFIVPEKNTSNAAVLYLENETFEGDVTISISGKGEWGLRDFKLYRIEKGRRIYEESGEEALKGWTVSGGTASFSSENTDFSNAYEEAQMPLVYRKGESVKYNVIYDDYENDSSKAQYWRYTHLPANDGLHPEAGRILSSPIEIFSIDGKYTAEHWQEDDTGRTDYDRQTNIAELRFYIEGGISAP